MLIRGSVTVILDEVDMEQALINSSGASKSTGTKIFLVMAAAFAKEQVISLKNLCDRTDHGIFFNSSHDYPGTSQIGVVFDIRALTKNEIIARDSGLS